MDMTPEQLEALGCEKIHWNPNYNGGFWEYYWAIEGDGLSRSSSRLSITFGMFGEKSGPVVVWLVLPSSRFALRHVQTVEQLEQMYSLLTGEDLREPRNVCTG